MQRISIAINKLGIIPCRNQELTNWQKYVGDNNK